MEPKAPSWLANEAVHDLLPGLAHFANDALHREITGLDNNCDFVEVRRKARPSRCGSTHPMVYLVATRDIRAGEELLVCYCMQYWLHKARDHLPPNVADWLAQHERIERELLGPGKIEQYLGVEVDEEEEGVRIRGRARYVVVYPSHEELSGVGGCNGCNGCSCDTVGCGRRVTVHLDTRFCAAEDTKGEKEERDVGVSMRAVCEGCDGELARRFVAF